jgi:hypothetical protein
MQRTFPENISLLYHFVCGQGEICLSEIPMGGYAIQMAAFQKDVERAGELGSNFSVEIEGRNFLVLYYSKEKGWRFNVLIENRAVTDQEMACLIILNLGVDIIKKSPERVVEVLWRAW